MDKFKLCWRKEVIYGFGLYNLMNKYFSLSGDLIVLVYVFVF